MSQFDQHGFNLICARGHILPTRAKIIRLLRGWTAFVGARTFIKCKHFPQHKINVLQLFMDDIFCLPNSNCSAFTVQGHFGGTDVAFSGSLNFCSYCCLLNGSCLEVLTCLSTDKKHRSCLKKINSQYGTS